MHESTARHVEYLYQRWTELVASMDRAMARRDGLAVAAIGRVQGRLVECWHRIVRRDLALKAAGQTIPCSPAVE